MRDLYKGFGWLRRIGLPIQKFRVRVGNDSVFVHVDVLIRGTEEKKNNEIRSRGNFVTDCAIAFPFP